MKKSIAISEINFSATDLEKIDSIRHYIALYKDIKQRDILDPIVLSKNNTILNGIARIAISIELGHPVIEYLKKGEDAQQEIYKYLDKKELKHEIYRLADKEADET